MCKGAIWIVLKKATYNSVVCKYFEYLCQNLDPFSCTLCFFCMFMKFHSENSSHRALNLIINYNNALKYYFLWRLEFHVKSWEKLHLKMYVHLLWTNTWFDRWKWHIVDDTGPSGMMNLSVGGWLDRSGSHLSVTWVGGAGDRGSEWPVKERLMVAHTPRFPSEAAHPLLEECGCASPCIRDLHELVFSVRQNFR